MGQEIKSSRFSNHDFSVFSRKLEQETRMLAEMFKNGQFSEAGGIGGFEIEAWLVSLTGKPAPVNHVFLEKLNNPLVVHELAAFNVELNSKPIKLGNNALSIMESRLQETWDACRQVASELSIDMLMTGILPSILEQQLTLANMSKLNRYQALNEQVIKLRDGRPLKLDITGKDTIRTSHHDVMFESACTSLQLHIQVPPENAARFYNASLILSGPMVAATANSPYLFGHELWDETRITLFEQAVELGDEKYRRVTFGNDYIKDSLFECFEENLEHYPVLVPFTEENNIDQLYHLRFHNGTIWRWNRPLIGFDENDKPHIRIEHRVVPSGPTVVDSIANAAFYFGLVNALADDCEALIEKLSFSNVKDNFYNCAKQGLSAGVHWPGYGEISVKKLLTEVLIPAARNGLSKLEISKADINKYLSIIEQRVLTEQNGANWQRKWVARHGKEMNRLTCHYLEKQNQGNPVHEWAL